MDGDVGNTTLRALVLPFVSSDNLSDSDRYRRQAEVVLRMAARAGSPAEKDVYLSIAEGWRKLAAEALRNERQDVAPERRSFLAEDPHEDKD